MAPTVNKSVGVWKLNCASSEETGSSATISSLSSAHPKMFPSYPTFFTPSYKDDFGPKTADKVECVRTGSSSGNRRNNPHPPHVSKADGHFMGLLCMILSVCGVMDCGAMYWTGLCLLCHPSGLHGVAVSTAAVSPISRHR